MDFVSLIAGLIAGLSLGIIFTWLALHLRSSRIRIELQTKLNAAEEQLKTSQRQHEENYELLSDKFTSLASEALAKNNESFLQLADQSFAKHAIKSQGDLDLRKQEVENLVKPLKDELNKIETERQNAYGGLKQLMESLAQGHQNLTSETRNLVNAFKMPQVRGRWGEMTLRRVAELAGMVEHCDFFEQATIEGDNSNKRPDMVVQLPNQRIIAIDAKTPLDAYLSSMEADSDDERKSAIKRHARQVRERAQELAKKSYWDALDYTPEFVVMFLPGEFFLGPALQEDPNLLEHAMSNKVVIATPTTLVSLLHAVAYGWRQEQLTENARRISELGKEMHDRLSIWTEHLDDLRDSLSKCVRTFNNGIGSLEQRVLVSARRFKEFGISTDKEIPNIEPIDLNLRRLANPDSDAIESPAADS